MARPTTQQASDQSRPVRTIEMPRPEHEGMEKMFAESMGGPLAIREAREVVAEKTLFGDVIMAQPTKKPRDEALVLRNIRTMAAAAGERWYYRFPVWNNRKRRTDYIEGISIKGTDSVARYYGNCRVESVAVDHGPYWMIYSRFCDLETGFTLIRPYKSDKEMVGGLKTEDRNRAEANALGIAVSKGQRIVVDHALNDFTVYGFEEAKKSAVEDIGKNLPKYRDVCVKRLQEMGPDIVQRVEVAHGRKATEWLAHDLAEIRAEIKNIDDGFESPDNTWPPPPPAEPKRSDVEEEPTHHPHAHDETAAPNGAAGAAAPDQATSPPPDQPPPNWRIGGEVLGQDAFLKAFEELLESTTSDAEQDALEAANVERLAKVTGERRRQIDVKLRDKRRGRHGG